MPGAMTVSIAKPGTADRQSQYLPAEVAHGPEEKACPAGDAIVQAAVTAHDFGSAASGCT